MVSSRKAASDAFQLFGKLWCTTLFVVNLSTGFIGIWSEGWERCDDSRGQVLRINQIRNVFGSKFQEKVWCSRAKNLVGRKMANWYDFWPVLVLFVGIPKSNSSFGLSTRCKISPQRRKYRINLLSLLEEKYYDIVYDIRSWRPTHNFVIVQYRKLFIFCCPFFAFLFLSKKAFFISFVDTSVIKRWSLRASFCCKFPLKKHSNGTVTDLQALKHFIFWCIFWIPPAVADVLKNVSPSCRIVFRWFWHSFQLEQTNLSELRLIKASFSHVFNHMPVSSYVNNRLFASLLGKLQ